MAHTLIVGKEFPDGAAFAEAARKCGRAATLTAAHSDPNNSAVEWNKSSPISARSVIIGAENLHGKIDEAVFVFDAAWYELRYRVFSAKDISRALDDMIAGYLYMTAEILERFAKKSPGVLAYVFKDDTARQNDAVKFTPMQGGQKNGAGSLTRVAEGAFRALAKNIASVYAPETFVNVMLVQGAYDDDELARWLFSYIDSVKDRKFFAKPKWITYGAKPLFALPFLKK